MVLVRTILKMLSLPLLVTDLFDELREPIHVYATPSDFDAIKDHLLTPRVWIPLEIMKNAYTELVEFHPIKAGESFLTEGLKITPIPVTHTILTHGMLVEDEQSAR